MTSGRFHTWQSGSRAQAALPPRKADQSAAPPPPGPRGLKYANPHDKYILILLEYKLMPLLTGCTGSGCKVRSHLAAEEAGLPAYSEVGAAR